MDTKKLRQKILDLAIRGKLVPQDPNDEPASVLLERIRAEKEQLIKEGKIKRAKKSAASDTSHYENVPYTLPNGWCWCKLGDLCSFESGFAFSSNDFKTSGIPLVRISNIQDSTVTLKNCVFIQDEVDEKYIIKTGDLLIAMSGATTGKMGIYSMRQRALLNQRVGNICVQSRYLTANYRNYFMYSQSDVILKMAYGGAQPNISSQMILNIPIPLPPLSEQHRIVNAIKNLLEIVDRIEENQISLDKFLCSIKQKILQLALSGNLLTQDHNDEPAIDLLRRINPSYIPCDNRHYENIQINIPNTWCWGKVGDLFEHNTGKALNSSNTNGSMLNYITTSNLYWDRFDLTVVKQMRFTDSEIEKCKATKGDLLLCEGGDVGRAAIWNYDFDIMIQNHIHRLRGKVDVSSRFFFYVFMLYKQKNYIGGKGVAIQGLSSRDLHNLPIPIPPLKEQYRIADTLDNLIAKMDKITAEL